MSTVHTGNIVKDAPTHGDIILAYKNRDQQSLKAYYAVLKNKWMFVDAAVSLLTSSRGDKIELYRFINLLELVFTLDEECYLMILNNCNTFDEPHELCVMLRDLSHKDEEMCKSVCHKYMTCDCDINIEIMEFIFFKSYANQSDIEHKLRYDTSHIGREYYHMLSDEFLADIALKALKLEMFEHYFESCQNDSIEHFCDMSWIDDEKILRFLLVFKRNTSMFEYIFQCIHYSSQKLELYHMACSC